MRHGKGRRVVGLLLAALVAFGCTIGPPEASSVAKGASSSAATPGLTKFQVIDRAGRFHTIVEATAVPVLSSYGGYVRAVIPLGTSQPLNCFVYDQPFVTGEAITRLLAAAERDVKYDRQLVESVELISGNPVVFLRADFTPTHPPAGVQGSLHVAVSPRVRFPVACTLEGKDDGVLFAASVRTFLQDLSPVSSFLQHTLSEGEAPLASEIWLNKDSGRPTGFRAFRAARTETGEVTALTVSVHLKAVGNLLRTSDYSRAERAQVDGLVSTRILELQDAEPTRRVVVQRSRSESGGGWLYTQEGVDSGGPITGSFRADTTVRSSFFGFAAAFDPKSPPEIAYDVLSAEPGSFRAVQVVRRLRPDGSVIKEQGNHRFITTLGGDGLPAHEVLEGTKSESELAHREIAVEDLKRGEPFGLTP